MNQLIALDRTVGYRRTREQDVRHTEQTRRKPAKTIRTTTGVNASKEENTGKERLLFFVDDFRDRDTRLRPDAISGGWRHDARHARGSGGV